MIIDIRLSEDLPTKSQNALRYAIELGNWRRQWREAEERSDWFMIDWLQTEYEKVGLP